MSVSLTKPRTTYSFVVFLDGDEGREVTDRLFSVEGVCAYGMTAESVAEALDYLSQWDYGDDYETYDDITEPAGSSDAIVFCDGGRYVIVSNLGLGYAALYRINRAGE